MHMTKTGDRNARGGIHSRQQLGFLRHNPFWKSLAKTLQSYLCLISSELYIQEAPGLLKYVWRWRKWPQPTCASNGFVLCWESTIWPHTGEKDVPPFNSSTDRCECMIYHVRPRPSTWLGLHQAFQTSSVPLSLFCIELQPVSLLQGCRQGEGSQKTYTYSYLVVV